MDRSEDHRMGIWGFAEAGESWGCGVLVAGWEYEIRTVLLFVIRDLGVRISIGYCSETGGISTQYFLDGVLGLLGKDHVLFGG